MNKQVLIVDDDELSVIVLRSLLENWGYRCSTASSSTHALQLALAHPFELVLSDYMLPDGDGMLLMQEIRKIPGYAPVPFLLITSFNGSIPKLEQCASNCFSVVPKPIDPERLQLALKQLNQPVLRTKLLDPNLLKEISGGKLSAMQHLAANFLEIIPANLEVLQYAERTQNYREMRRTLHKIRPNFAYIGLERAIPLIDLIQQKLGEELPVSSELEELTELTKTAASELMAIFPGLRLK